MAVLLGIDTGGTYTDAVLLDDAEDVVIARAKSLTTRPDLAIGIGAAIDKVLTEIKVDPKTIAMVSLSTTLATNALVEGQGGRIALVLIGFKKGEETKGELSEALRGDPVIYIDGGHNHSGTEARALDTQKLLSALETMDADISAVAIAGLFATRNSEHEDAARELVRATLGIPVTCSQELSQSLGGPKRAVTALLNARLIGLIDRLISATERHIASRQIDAPLMVVRGDGALMSSDLARERPVETILSGPAASIAGAQWLTGEKNAIVSDIGGTTTDVCLLSDGMPRIDPKGAKVGPFRTMVEAVAMRTFGLGGDSEVVLAQGLEASLQLGPRRVVPISLLANSHSKFVHSALDRALSLETPPEEATRFVLAQWKDFPSQLDAREEVIASRLINGPLQWSDAVLGRIEQPALGRLVQRGLVILSDVTPSDASHVLGRMGAWDGLAAEKALTVFARRRVGSGNRIAKDAGDLAHMIVGQLTRQTVWALLETAFSDEGWDQPEQLARHVLVEAGLRQHQGIVRLDAGLSMPVIGLGASASTYYDDVRKILGCVINLPSDGAVANAIGAVVSQVAIHAEGAVTGNGEGAVMVHFPDGPTQFCDKKSGIEALRKVLTEQAIDGAKASGVDAPRVTETLDLREAQIEARSMFIEAKLRVTARGRPRIAR